VRQATPWFQSDRRPGTSNPPVGVYINAAQRRMSRAALLSQSVGLAALGP